MIIWVKEDQVFYSPKEGSQKVFLPENIRATAVELDPRNNEYNDLSLEQVKEIQKYNITSHKHEAQEKGVLWNGVLCDCSDESQNKLSVVSNAAQLKKQMGGSLFPLNFKFKDGSFRELSENEFYAMAATVGDFVQSLFTNESTKFALIDSATTKEEVCNVTW